MDLQVRGYGYLQYGDGVVGEVSYETCAILNYRAEGVWLDDKLILYINAPVP